MFSCLFQDKQIRVIMIGLDGVGKTSILHRLKLQEELKSTIPTIGFNIETIDYTNIQFTFFDIGGVDKIRLLMHRNHFIIDQSDPNDWQKKKKELMRFLNEMKQKVLPYWFKLINQILLDLLLRNQSSFWSFNIMKENFIYNRARLRLERNSMKVQAGQLQYIYVQNLILISTLHRRQRYSRQFNLRKL
ncbi:unnamed protein product (macronuclear) [Paramecium tetraurelia]|uniref:Uncharacterized protein n=1 Tax=Paramecium tetraurelia TaxID=5888 RepID=A0DUJ3_PARTE|nr:uncharacterized protein GSPATT00020382001 [Paramecium tetraurelia]CAK86710.1 unnamed protein product [Paramecium tetraurelia]|eukprot:XP_001454107.1 hypothetical protein (macronuclear) [Paramecium tetraurelia strain d4-2]